MKCVILKGYLDLWMLNSGVFTYEWKDNIDTNRCSSHGKKPLDHLFQPHCIAPWVSLFHLVFLSFFLYFSCCFCFLSKPATDESTWVLLGFYPEKDGAQTDPCMSDVGHTVHGAGSLASVWHCCSPCLPTGGVVGD